MNRLKRVMIYSLCLIIFICAETTFADKATINHDHLNVRTGPGTTFDQIKKVHTNEVYSIIQTEGEWTEITFDDQSGWVKTEYITIEQEELVSEAKTPTDEPISKQNDSIVIEKDNIHIRKGPHTDYEIIHFANHSDTFNIISEDDDWYEIELKTGSGFLFKDLIKKQVIQTNLLKGKTIVIDPGHGGRDVGSISISELYEKDFTLKSAMALEETLTMLGANVVLTRTHDDYIGLNSRAELANLHTADAFISIHYNSFPDLANVSGIDTYYYDDYDQQFAQIIQQEIIKETNANDRKTNYGNFQVLRQNLQPALLLELGFISNYNEEQLLQTDAYQEKIVKGIVNGLTKYFQMD